MLLSILSQSLGLDWQGKWLQLPEQHVSLGLSCPVGSAAAGTCCQCRGRVSAQCSMLGTDKASGVDHRHLRTPCRMVANSLKSSSSSSVLKQPRSKSKQVAFCSIKWCMFLGLLLCLPPVLRAELRPRGPAWKHHGMCWSGCLDELHLHLLSKLLSRYADNVIGCP